MIPTVEQAENEIEESPEEFGEVATIRAKWMFNDCDSLEEMKERLEEAKKRISSLRDAGFTVRENKNDDYIHIEKQ